MPNYPAMQRALGNMAEPPAATREKWEKVSDALDWAYVKGSLRTALLAALGFGENGDEPLRILANITEAKIDATINELKVGDKKLLPAQRAMVGTAWAAAQIACGVRTAKEDIDWAAAINK